LKEYQSLPQQHFPKKHEHQRVLNREGILNSKESYTCSVYPEESPYRSLSITVTPPCGTPNKFNHESPVKKYNFLKDPAPLPKSFESLSQKDERNNYKTVERQKNRKAI
jgi:hypothetical protein